MWSSEVRVRVIILSVGTRESRKLGGESGGKREGMLSGVFDWQNGLARRHVIVDAEKGEVVDLENGWPKYGETSYSTYQDTAGKIYEVLLTGVEPG